MAEIEVRAAIAEDIPILVNLDHSYISAYVWQMVTSHSSNGTSRMQPSEESAVGELSQSITFREVRYPRPARVQYPHSPKVLLQDWQNRSGLLVALFKNEPIGYVSLALNRAPNTTWVTDLVVRQRLRRKGIGRTLILATHDWAQAQDWAANQKYHRLVMEMQTKNYPAISLAQKMGFDFCGYIDRYYPNGDIGLFFAKTLW
jgi:GNAT superfamily N-acetyltransferase